MVIVDVLSFVSENYWAKILALLLENLTRTPTNNIAAFKKHQSANDKPIKNSICEWSILMKTVWCGPSSLT
jgi:hypothetical protein